MHEPAEAMAQRPSQKQDHHEEQLFQMRQYDYPPPPPPPPIHPDLEHASLYPTQQLPQPLAPVHPYGAPTYQQDNLPPRPQQPLPIDQAPQATAGEAPVRVNRLRKACDACSVRKVKCDEAGPPCRACAALDIPCTFDRPSRRRGPPNKHAEAIKRQRMDQQGNAFSMPASPSTADQNLRDLLVPQIQPQQHEQYLSAESIAPLEFVTLLVEDYFIFCHPLTPFPHEIWFREAFEARRDLQDRTFLALIAGMVGCLIATFPRRAFTHMKALGREDLFRNTIDLINRCQMIVHEARGTGYLERDTVTAHDAAISYFLFAMLSCTYRFQAARLYLSECVAMLRQMNLYDDEEHNQLWIPFRGDGEEGAAQISEPPNMVDREMARRIFWTAFVTGRSAKTFGFSWVEPYMNPASPNAPHPPLPVEVDDEHIFHDSILQQPLGMVPKIAGFNANVRVYLTLDPLIAIDALYGIDQAHGWREQLRILDNGLGDVKQSLDSLPIELTAWPRAMSSSPSLEHQGPVKREFLTLHSSNLTLKERHTIAYETQKANIYASYLSVRSYFIERHWALMKAHVLLPSATQHGSLESDAQKKIRAEREAIAQDLLDVLSHIKPIHIEPNSVSLLMKIRQVASTLLESNSGVSEDGERPLAEDDRAAKFLRTFLVMLTALEKFGKREPDHNDAMNHLHDEDEVMTWADLRAHQKEFVKGE